MTGEVRRIVWNKWVDPLTEIKPPRFHDPELQEQYDTIVHEDKDPDTPAEAPTSWGYQGPVVTGPFGIIPIGDHNKPGKLYNLWIADTNFNVDYGFCREIEKLDGVELMRVFTRYRMMIGIGRLFDTDKVQKSVEELMKKQAEALKPPVKQEKPVPAAGSDAALQVLKRSLAKRHKFWAIIIRPNNTHITVTGENQADVLVKMNRLKGTSDRTVTSWDENAK
jgi:hypothetical protein